jgi:hypothetical protein
MVYLGGACLVQQNKIKLSNEDHCGSCGEYIKIEKNLNQKKY